MISQLLVLSDIGGFLWWLIVKFCSTDLEDEQLEKNWTRNILTLVVLGLVIGYISVNFF